VLDNPLARAPIRKMRIPLGWNPAEVFEYLDTSGKGYVSAEDLVDGCSKWHGDYGRAMKVAMAKRSVN